jgi:phosphoglycolate phosphatase
MFPFPKVILMDLCGTLLDSLRIDRQVMDSIGMRFAGKNYAELRPLKESAKSMRYNFKNFFGDRADMAHQAYMDQLIEQIPNTELFPGAHNFLHAAKRAGIDVALISNRPASYIEQAIDVHKLGPFITRGFSAIDDFTAEKPDGAVIDQALHLLGHAGLDKGEVAFIGDTIVDVQCADNAGCIPVIYTGNTSEYELNHLHQREGDLSKPKVHIFSDYSEISLIVAPQRAISTLAAKSPEGPK